MKDMMTLPETKAGSSAASISRWRHLRAALVALGLLVVANGCVSRLFYYPTDQVYHEPSEFELEHEEVHFESTDGTSLHGWFFPARGEAKGTVVHFHGNAGNISGHFLFVRWLPGRGFNVFTFDYRGYGKSEGRPGRFGCARDGLAALQYAAQREDVDGDRIFVLGQSLGGAIALAAVSQPEAPKVQALAVDSAFYSYTSIVRDKIGLIPVVRYLKWPLSYLLITNLKSPSLYIDEVAPTPLFIIHGTADLVIPFHHGERLYRAASEPKTLVPVEEGRHTTGLVMEDPVHRDQLEAFFMDAL